MKKIVLLLVLTSLSFVYANGQGYFRNDAVWHYDYYVSGSGFYKIEVKSDTIIQGEICQTFQTKKYTFFVQPNGVYLQGSIFDMPNEYTYSSGDTVFYFENGKFFTLFNFNAKIGDKWIISDTAIGFPSADSISQVEVMDTGSIVINGVSHRKILLQTVDGSALGIDAWIIENIGPIGGQFLFPTGRNLNDSTIICYESHTFKCYEDSVLGLYNPSGIECEYLLNHVGIIERGETIKFQIYPNPNSGIFNVKFNESGDYQMILTDLNGRIIKSKKLSKQQEIINISEFPDGLYYLKIETKAENILSKKIIKI